MIPAQLRAVVPRVLLSLVHSAAKASIVRENHGRLRY